VIVLLSGGLDSATCLYWAVRRGYKVFALSFDYGQRHSKEICCAARIARGLKVPFRVVKFTLPWGGSALTDRQRSLPVGRKIREMSSGKIPATYVPARNTVFLSFAFSYADAAEAEAVIIGANAIDYSGYPDCRPAYLKSMEKVARLGTKSGTQGRGIKILAPLVRKTKSQIIRMGRALGVPYERSWSCYMGRKKPCGKCDSCILREKGFKDAGLKDPLINIV